MLRTIFFLLCFCWPLSIISQNITPEIEWEKTFGGKGNDVALALTKVNGGFVIVGYTTSNNIGVKDIYVIKLDKNGNKLWEKQLGGYYNDIGNAVVQTKDNGIILTGYTSKSAGYKVLNIIKLDHDGKIVWEKYIDSNQEEEAKSIISTNNNEFVLTGYKSATLKKNILVMKINHQGNRIWEKEYDLKGFNIGNTIINTIDNGFLICAFTKSYPAYPMVLKISEFGAKYWEQIFELHVEKRYANSLITASNENYILAGNLSYGAPFLLKFDNNGSIIWKKSYSEFTGYYITEIIQVPNETYAICGISKSKDVWFMNNK